MSDEKKENTLTHTKPGWPTPTVPRPTMEQFEEWCISPICEATDGCRIEPDGVCSHGHPSWLLYLDII